MKLKNVSLTVAGMIAGAGLTLATIGGPAASVSAQQDAYAAAQKAQVLAVIYHLDKVGFHGMEDSIKGGTVPAGSLGAVQRARTAMMAVDWPAAANGTVNALNEQMTALEAALKTEDVAAAANPIHEVHEGGHELSSAVYAWLKGAAPNTPADPTGQPAAKPAHGH